MFSNVKPNTQEITMKLLNSFGPNPRMVRMFMLEKKDRKSVV